MTNMLEKISLKELMTGMLAGASPLVAQQCLQGRFFRIELRD
jgi:hypothetical protein